MLRRLSLAVLLAALLLAQQTLGQLHRHAHGPVPAGPELAALFQGHQQDGDCRLYDQLATGDALTALPVLALALPLPAPLVRFLADQTLVRHAAPYAARAPPVSL